MGLILEFYWQKAVGMLSGLSGDENKAKAILSAGPSLVANLTKNHADLW